MLLHTGLNLSYVTPLATINFRIGPKKLSKPFLVFTSVGKLVIARWVYKKCPIIVLHKIILADIIKLKMVNFNIILGMD